MAEAGHEDDRPTPRACHASACLKAARGLPRSGELLPIDLAVLDRLRRLRAQGAASCWTSIRFLAREVRRSQRTVWRSLGRLLAAEQIDRVRVARPDPDDPRNRTGWRFVFPGGQEGRAAQATDATDRNVTRIARARARVRFV
jgi:hypothetical protein